MTADHNFANAYAATLLRDVGWHTALPPTPCEHPAVSWASSGLMNLTGHANSPGLMCPVPLAAVADGAIIAFAALSGSPQLNKLRGAALLGQRARLMQLRRNGRTSPGGACRLLQALDGWIALSLARLEDWACIPAFLNGAAGETWEQIEAATRRLSVKHLLARAHLLGLAAANAGCATAASAWFETTASPRELTTAKTKPVVIDLSTLWAGPLCGQLLHRAGASVVKVESTTRPDGARAGHGGFYDFLNAGKRSATFDFRRPSAIEMLRQMIERADIVIESARPRALRQLGLNAESLVAENPGLTWISITGHGRHPPHEHRIGFGDDAAAAAGLCHIMQTAHGNMVFCGDAIADPLAGMHAALAGWAAWQKGGGMVSVSLKGVVAHGIAQGATAHAEKRAHDWSKLVREPPAQLALPAALGAARRLGADTQAVLTDFAVPC